ncbi:MAG: hypothetical protein R2731_01780 [Nocardioides sp.]
MTRPATPDDVEAICAELPETELGTSWGDVPTWKVPTGEKGRGFLLYRKPHKTALDPETGEPYDDLLVIMVPDPGAKAALVEDPATPSSPSTTSAASTPSWCSSRGWGSWRSTSSAR